MKKYFYIIAILALGITACTKNELRTPADDAAAPGAEAPVFHFSIPASIGATADTKAVTIGEESITSIFANTDKVYVFIEGQGANAGKLAVAHNGTDASTYLTPSNINGATCDLTGALKFYYNNSGNFAAFEPSADDVVYLFYNMNDPVMGYASLMYQAGLLYGKQNGSKDQDVYWSTYLASHGASTCDFAEAKMKVTAVTGNGTDGYSLTMVQYDDNTKSNVHFENMGSMFRQRLSFTDKNNQPIISIPTLDELAVSFEGGYIVREYCPFNPNVSYSPLSEMSISNPIVSAEGDVYLALMFYDSNKNQSLVLKATDTDGNVYSVTKAAPTGGFQNGKYYYGSTTFAWQKCIKPTVTGTSATPVYDGSDRRFTVTDNPVDLTISGNSEGYVFSLSEGHGGTITLDNVAASSSFAFISQSYNDPNADVSLVLTGTNSITCNNQWGILVYGNLKLSCTGTSATLTVTAQVAGCCGIQGKYYRSDGLYGVSCCFNEYWFTTGFDVPSIAAPGYAVTRSARTDNANGTYTWTYTVTPTPYSAAAVGKVIGADGVIYDDAAAATTAGTTAEALIVYVGSQPGVCANGLAISLTDVYASNATFAEATGNAIDAIIPSWRTSHAIPGGNWRLPTEMDWQYMMWGEYTDNHSAAPVGTVKSVLNDGYYWTRTEIDDDHAKGIYYNGGTTNASIISAVKTGTLHVRACYAF